MNQAHLQCLYARIVLLQKIPQNIIVIWYGRLQGAEGINTQWYPESDLLGPDIGGGECHLTFSIDWNLDLGHAKHHQKHSPWLLVVVRHPTDPILLHSRKPDRHLWYFRRKKNQHALSCKVGGLVHAHQNEAINILRNYTCLSHSL